MSKLYIQNDVNDLPRKERPCLLVVDRDPAVVDFVARRLDGFQTVQVPTDRDLAVAVATYQAEVVLCNTPPGQMGPQLRTLPRQLLLLHCSLHSHSWVSDALDVAGFLVKPITSDTLLSALDRFGPVHDILILDDDRGFRQLVERYLHAAGNNTRLRHAYNGVDGIESMRRQVPDLVLLDLIMPEMDGFQVLEVMKKDAQLSTVPVLILTASNYGEDLVDYDKSQIVVRRPGGLGAAETLRCVQALLGTCLPQDGRDNWSASGRSGDQAARLL